MSDITGILASFTPATYGIWALFAVVSVTLIKAWPILAKQAIEARAEIRKEGRADLSDCHARLDDQGRRIDELNGIVTNLKIELNGILGGYRILEVDVETRDPLSPALKAARAVLSTAFTIAPSTPSNGAEPLGVSQ